MMESIPVSILRVEMNEEGLNNETTKEKERRTENSRSADIGKELL